MFFQPPAMDLTLFLFINQEWRCELLNILMPIFSSTTVLCAVLAIALVFAVFKWGKRQILYFVILLVGVGLCDLSTNVIKKEVKRVRPLNAIPGTHHQAQGYWEQRAPDFKQTQFTGNSFPSAHASNSMCLAVLAMLLWPALKKWPLLLPLLTGYSRVYLGKHYPTDVVGGWLYGIVVSLSIWLLWHWLRRYFQGEQ